MERYNPFMLTPLLNDALFGHSETEAQLLRLIQQKKLPHALLFAGQEGIGKATLAYRLAKYLLTGAEAPAPVMGLFGPEPVEESLTSDPEHPALRRIAAGSHGDLLIIQPEFDEKKKTSVDTVFVEQTRAVVEFMRRTPAESDWRIVLIDPAEAMNTAAANALLKVLEEPPAQALLILVSHQPGRLLPTIKSRCRKITLRTPDAGVTARIFEHLGKHIPADELRALMVLAQGSAGRALHYHAHHALDAYLHLAELLAAPTPKGSAAFASQAAKSTAENWQVTRALFLQVLYRLSLYAAARKSFVPLDNREPDFFALMLARQPLDAWLALWEKAEMLLQQTGSLMLDKQQVMLSLLHAASAKAQAA